MIHSILSLRSLLFALLPFLSLVVLSIPVEAATRTWTGGGKYPHRWSDPANWSDGQVPGPTDDAVIPGDPPADFIVADVPICVQSLTLQDGSLYGGKIRGGGALKEVSIKAGTIYVGDKCKIFGDHGRYRDDLPDGGSVIIRGYSLTNRGTIEGGSGASEVELDGGAGGSVTIELTGPLDNTGGTIEAGSGGSPRESGLLGPTRPYYGGDAGSVKTDSETLDSGTIKGGQPGRGLQSGSPAPAYDGITGGTKSTTTGPLFIPPTGMFFGKDVSLHSESGDVLMVGREVPAIEATGSVGVSACPSCIIDMSGNPFMIPEIVAGESICLSAAMIILDPFISLDMVTIPPAETPGAGDPCDPTPSCPETLPFEDGLEEYPYGNLGGQGRWKGWDNDPAFDAPVTDFLAHSGFASVEIAGASNLIKDFCVPEVNWPDDTVVFEGWQYIPSDFVSGSDGDLSGSYFILLNTYSDGGLKQESVRMRADSTDGLLKVHHGDGSNTVDVPYATDRWVKIQVEVDLEDDWTRVYYDDEFVTEYSWTGAVTGEGGGALDIAAVDLYANASTSIYYDDFNLKRDEIPHCFPSVPWYEDFDGDDYESGSGVGGNGTGWKGWDDDPAFDAPVTDTRSQSGSKSLEVGGSSNALGEFCPGALGESDTGAWRYSGWQYIPSEFTSGSDTELSGSYFILLNTYSSGGTKRESVRVRADSTDGLLKVSTGNGENTVNVPYETDRWVKIQADIDLEDDWTQVYYDDELVAEYIWTGGVLGEGGGALDIAAVDLYANGSTSVYYDDLRLEPLALEPEPTRYIRGDGNADGRVNIADPSFIANFVFGVGLATPPSCESAADTNADNRINIADPAYLANFLFGIAPATPPPAPNPSCGTGDEDTLSCESYPACVPSVIPGFTFVDTNAEGFDEYGRDQTGIRFVLLPGGSFEMGSPDTEVGRAINEGPLHEVDLSSFLISKFEVTQAEWEDVMGGGSNPSSNVGTNHPVTNVSWDDIQAFEAASGLQLASEAQWEYACRAGSAGPVAGNGVLDNMAWYLANSAGLTLPVGGKLANGFGIHDMHGNVWEWCEDIYDETYYSQPAAAGPDPVSLAGSVQRVVRGGAIDHDETLTRSAYRDKVPPAASGSTIGFRVVALVP